MVNLSRTQADVWPKRVSLVLAVVLLGLVLPPLVGWILEIESFVRMGTNSDPIRANTVISLLIFAVVLLAVELGSRKLAWLALIPTAIGGISLIQSVTDSGLTIDELIFPYFIARGLPSASSTEVLRLTAAKAARMAPPVAACLFTCGLILISLVRSRLSQRHTLILALVASATFSVGTATLLGYALTLSTIAQWGFSDITPRFTAIAISVSGLAILARAWREHTLNESGAPTWLPLPVVVGSTTLTIILFFGLEDQEIVRLKEESLRNANDLAQSLDTTMVRQADQLDRLANRWNAPNQTDNVRRVDAESYVNENDNGGGQSVSLIGVDPDYSTLSTYPSFGNEHLANYSHGRDPVRRAAIERAISPPIGVTVSGSINVPTRGPGYAIYVPVVNNGSIEQLLGADFTYSQVIAHLIESNKNLNPNSLYRVSIGDEILFDSTLRSGPLDQILDRYGGVDLVFSIHDRRMRFAAVRTPEAFARDKRNLPQMAFAAGLGITLLLGLSVHFARSNYSARQSAELSNRRLQAENEERRRVEAMLKVSDERLRLALDSTQIGIFEWNLPSNQIYYSPGLWTMLDYGPDEVGNTPESWTALMHPDDLNGYRLAVEQQLAGDETFITPEYRLRTGKGEWRWIYARSKTVARAPSGAPFRIIGTLQDITDRKAAEAALRESQAATRKLSHVASRTDNLVIITSPQGAVEWVNESFTRVMEYELDEIRGISPEAVLIGPETDRRSLRRLRATLARGQGITTDVVNYSKSGRKYHLHLEVQPVRNEQGGVETFIAILADITTRVETENALRRAKTEADTASRAKSEFLASMSHEIRTPMNGVIGMTSLLMDTRLDPEQRDFVNTIRTSGEALLTIINDILDFSKIESGKMELEHLPFDLPTCIEEALDLFAMQAASKRLDLAYFMAEDVPAWIMGDITRLRQILVNLVNNAVKFTASGSITIQVRRKPRIAALPTDHRLQLEVIVQDTGIGIPSERINRLFKPFSQVDSSTTRKYGGTGLGLAICHRLSQLMGGGIHVESTIGEGSRFIFSVRTEPAHPLNLEPLPPVPAVLQKGRVLGIEDNDIGQRRLSAFFHSWKIGYDAAPSIGVARIRLEKDPAPALVLLDQDLLQTEGGAILLELIDLKKIPTLYLHVPGNSASAPPQRPFILPLNKPLKTSTLLRGVHSLFRDQNDPAAAAPTIPERRNLAEEFPLDVLLVEDNAVNQKVAMRFLERLGYRADAVGNGLEALQAFEARPFNLILMDLQMPEMDGFEASREIRRRFPADRQPKIIALTANALQGDREFCIAAGMDDYVTKPVKLHELSEVIRRQFAPRTEDFNVPQSHV